MPKAIHSLSVTYATFCAVFVMSFLLYLPAAYHAINTPFAFIDDLSDWSSMAILESPRTFFDWLHAQTLGVVRGRWRPIFELNAAVTWKVFGTNSHLHHAWRLLIRLVSSYLAASTVSFFTEGTKNKLWIKLVLFLVLVFFPNNPEARLAPQELFLVFFFSLAIYLVTKIYFKQKIFGRSYWIGPLAVGSAVLGMVSSKEIGFTLVPAIFLYVVFSNFNWKRHLPTLIVTTALAGWALSRSLSIGSHHASRTWTAASLGEGLSTLLSYVFNPFRFRPLMFLFLAGFILCVAALIRCLLSKNFFVRADYRAALAVFVGWCSFSLVSIMLPMVCPRYAFPSAWLAVMTCFLVLTAVLNSRKLTLPSSIPAIFLAVFFLYTYENFLFQFRSQYENRTRESELIDEIAGLQLKGHRIWVEPDIEFSEKLVTRFDSFAKAFGLTGEPLAFITPEVKPEAGDLVVRHSDDGPDKPIIYRSAERVPSKVYELARASHRLACLGWHQEPVADCGGAPDASWLIYRY